MSKTNEIPNHFTLIRRYLFCSHSNGDLFTCEDNMLSGYHLKENFGKKFLTNGNGLENTSEKRNGLESYHLQNTR